MELTILAGKQKVHKSAVVRNRCKRRLQEAIRLVVTRGAGGKEPRGEGGDVTVDELERGVRKWLVPGQSSARRGSGDAPPFRGSLAGADRPRWVRG